jgi:ribosomal protein S1
MDKILSEMKKILWQELKRSIKPFQTITGTVVRNEPYGVYVDLEFPFEGLIQITDLTDKCGLLGTKDFPPIGQKITAVVLGFKENNHQIWLGTKKSQLAKTIDLGK